MAIWLMWARIQCREIEICTRSIWRITFAREKKMDFGGMMIVLDNLLNVISFVGLKKKTKQMMIVKH